MVDSANSYYVRRKAIRNSWLKYLTAEDSPLTPEDKKKYASLPSELFYEIIEILPSNIPHAEGLDCHALYWRLPQDCIQHVEYNLEAISNREHDNPILSSWQILLFLGTNTDVPLELL
jgi:hypothetical protein